MSIGEFGGCLELSEVSFACKENEASFSLTWDDEHISGCSSELKDIDLPKGATGPVTCGPNEPSHSFQGFLRDETYVGCLEHSNEEDHVVVECGPHTLRLNINWGGAGGDLIVACVALPRYSVQ